MTVYYNAKGEPAAEPDLDPPALHNPALPSNDPIEPLNFEQCQAPRGPAPRAPTFKALTPEQHVQVAKILLKGKQCLNKPTVVMVENEPRSSHGKIHSMTLCESCRDYVLRTQGQDYALFTPLG
jgi:hypothetical protein